jgi:hypothetical protein
LNRILLASSKDQVIYVGTCCEVQVPVEMAGLKAVENRSEVETRLR